MAPIGEHRAKFVVPSTGKRNKRKRKITREIGSSSRLDIEETQLQRASIPPSPEIASFLTIGFNSTERALESASKKSVPATISETTVDKPSWGPSKVLAAVFVDRSNHPSILYAHLPQLIATTSLACPSHSAIRLIALPNGASKRMSSVLQIPHVSIVGLYAGAPRATPLIDLVRNHVSPIEIPWLKSLILGTYLPVEIKFSKTAVSTETWNSVCDSDEPRHKNPKRQPESRTI